MQTVIGKSYSSFPNRNKRKKIGQHMAYGAAGGAGFGLAGFAFRRGLTHYRRLRAKRPAGVGAVAGDTIATGTVNAPSAKTTRRVFSRGARVRVRWRQMGRRVARPLKSAFKILSMPVRFR